MASLMNASEESTVRSRSLLSRRHLPSHANVRSTVHRIGSLTQPLDPSGRLTMTSSHRACRRPTCTGHSYGTCCRRTSAPPGSLVGLPAVRRPPPPPWRRLMSAAVTSTASSKPMLSTTMWRLRPSTFLALSRPRCSPPEVVSRIGFHAGGSPGRVGLLLGPRTLLRSRSWIVSRVPLCRHWSK